MLTNYDISAVRNSTLKCRRDWRANPEKSSNHAPLLRGAVYTVCVISFNHRLSAAPLWLTFGHTLAPIVVKLDLDKDHIFSKLA